MRKTVALIVSLLLAVSMISSMAFAQDAEAQDAAVEEAVEAVETVEEAAEEAVEAVEEAAEEAVEAVEDAAEEAEEAVEDAAEEAEEEADDAEAEEAVPEEDAGESDSGESSYLPVEYNLSETGEILLEDYSTIEVSQELVEVTDEEVENYLTSIANYATTTETVTEGTVENGDHCNIDFSGVLEGEEEPFAGGTAQGYEIVLGSGTFIPGFEEQIVGHSIGETFDINVTFPEEYTEDLAGKNAIFTITLNSKTVSVTPEMNDEFVKKFSEENMDQQFETVDELREYTYNYLYHNKLQSEIMNVLEQKETIVSYREDQFELMKTYALENLAYTASQNGMDQEMIAQIYGYETSDNYASAEAMYYMDMIMLLDQVAADKGIECTEEDLNKEIEKYIRSYDLEEQYTVDQFKEMSGEGWVLLFSKLTVEYEKVMEALEENVVFVQGSEYMSYDEFMAADFDEEVTVAVYVQATQDWWEDQISVYGADQDGGYFIYNMACSEEDAEKLVPGTKIIVNGYKALWSEEVEIADATFTFAEDPEDTYFAMAVDVTEALGTDELASYMNQFVGFRDLTVEPSVDADGNESAFLYNWDGSGTPGNDLYFNVSHDGETYTFTVESYLCGQDTDVYKAVEGLQIGDVIDAQGFLYWYNGANPHITNVTVK